MAKIKLRRDSSANWALANPVLAPGEPGYDTTVRKLKIGDGVTSWTSLTYVTSNLETITSNLQSQIDYVKSNLNPAALDSLTEIVAAISVLESNASVQQANISLLLSQQDRLVSGPGNLILDAGGNITVQNMIKFSSGALVDSSDNNVEIRGIDNFNIESRNVVNIYTDTQGNGYQWQFDDNGDLRVPNNLRISSVEQVGENVGPYETDIYGNYVGGQTDSGFSTAINLGNSIHDDLFDPPIPNGSTTTGSIAANGDFTKGSNTGIFDVGTVIQVNGQIIGTLNHINGDPDLGLTLANFIGMYSGPVVNTGTLIQGYSGWIVRAPRTATFIQWADGTSTQVTGSEVNQYPQSVTGFLLTATNVSTKPFPITIYTANYVPAKIGAGANNKQLLFTADGDLTVPNQIFVRTGIRAEMAVSPAPYISGFSSISTAGNPGNITASGYLVASQGIHTTGNITVGKNIYGSYRSGISNAIQFRPNIAVDKRFLFTVDSINGDYVRSGLDMPSAEIDKAVTLSFPHDNSNAGYIYVQGADSGATDFNDAFNIMMNSGNVKISALSYADGNKVWNFTTSGQLIYPDATVQTTAFTGTATPNNIINTHSGTAVIYVGGTQASTESLSVRVTNVSNTLGVEIKYSNALTASSISAFREYPNPTNIYAGLFTKSGSNNDWDNFGNLTTVGDSMSVSISDHSNHKIYRVLVTARAIPDGGSTVGDAYCVIEKLK